MVVNRTTTPWDQTSPAAAAENGIATMKERLPALSPAEDEAVLREAGFTNVELFYAGFTFKGWVAYRS